jgi:predicted transcriptional regulator
MTSDHLFHVKPDDDVDSVMSTMKSKQVRRIPVVEDDRIVGMIAQADIARGAADDAKTGEVVERISEPNAGRR